MADVTLRFFGRFFYAVPSTPGTIQAMAPKFEDGFTAHQTHMSIRRDKLVWTDTPGGAVQTTVAPTFKAVTDAALSASELFVWDLSNRRVSFDVDGGPSLGGSELLDFAFLESLGSRPAPTLKSAALEIGAAGLSNAIVDVSAGTGVPLRMVSTAGQHAFVTKEDAQDMDPDNDQELEDPPGSGKPARRALADSVEFTVPLPGKQTTLKLTLKDDAGTVVGQVTVKADTVVSFSNLCPPLPRVQTYDLEFSRYYDLLASGPSSDDQVIPKEPPTTSLGEGADCWVQARITHP